MNILNERWSKFKQELLPILYLSAIQIWWSFNNPAYMRLNSPWNTIVSTMISIVGIACVVVSFSFADKFSPFPNLDYLIDAPFGRISKKIKAILYIAVSHISILFVWYKDFYHASNDYYAITYIFMVLVLALLYQAKHRWPSE